MAHYAKIEANIVTDILVIDDFEVDGVEDIDAQENYLAERYPDDTFLKVSYNTYKNEHALGGTPLRGNCPGVGSIYDVDNDVFYDPQPYDSWTLNTDTWHWEPPVAMPVDSHVDDETDPEFFTSNFVYEWDEDNLQWVAAEKEYPDTALLDWYEE